MAGVVTRSGSLFTDLEWDELYIPESYRAEIVQGALVVYPAPEWQESGLAPPISLREWRKVTVPENYRAEIVQSEFIVSPAASFPHGRVQMALARLFDPVLPEGYEVLINMEWLYEERGQVAQAPQPDVIVTPVGIDELWVPPLFAVEVLSPSDADRLKTGSKLTRREGKRLDYAANGLTDFLEIDLASGRPVVIRYENNDGVFAEVERGEGDKPLVVDRPFSYELVPENLLAR